MSCCCPCDLAWLVRQPTVQKFNLCDSGKRRISMPRNTRLSPLLSKARPEPWVTHQSNDDAFIGLLDAYRPHGGLSRMSGIPIGQRYRCEGEDRLVSELVQEGELFGFCWHDSYWIPLFQLDVGSGAVETKARMVASTLGADLDGWALAIWFVMPNKWLQCHSPIECLGSRIWGCTPKPAEISDPCFYCHF